MPNTPPRDRCLLCGLAVDDSDVLRHLRVEHEVLPGESTVADVPAGGVQSRRDAGAFGRDSQELSLVEA